MSIRLRCPLIRNVEVLCAYQVQPENGPNQYLCKREVLLKLTAESEFILYVSTLR